MRLTAGCHALVVALALAGCGGSGSGSDVTSSSGHGQVTGAGGSGGDGSASSTSGGHAGGGGAGGGGTSSSADSSSSVASASASSSTAVSSSSAGTGGAACANTDPGEPNETESTAYSFGALGCSDSDPGMFYGVLDGPGDVDWFTFDGSDDLSCEVNPAVTLTAESGFPRICAFFACHKGGTDPGACPQGSTAATSPDGHPGCCGYTTFEVDLNCTGTTDDSANVYVRIDDPSQQAVCTGYSVSFHY